MIPAIEFAVILFLFGVAAYIVTTFVLRHSKKNDPLVRDLNTLFYKRRPNNKLNK